MQIGNNSINIKVIAEDQNFSTDIIINIYMKSNDTTLMNVAIPGIWSPDFSESQLIYDVNVNFGLNSIPV